MSFDQHVNFAYSTIQAGSGVIGSSSATSAIIAGSGDLPDPALGQYNVVVWPAGLQPLSSNAEIMRVTGKSGTTLTVTRAQEGTIALTSIAAGHQVAQNITRKWFADLEAVLPPPGSGLVIPSQLAFQPCPAQTTAFTYTASVAADSAHPDTGGVLLNDAHVNVNTTISGNQALQLWDSATGQITSPPVGTGYTAPTWASSTWGPLWNNTNPTLVIDMGSAKTPTVGIFWWGNIDIVNSVTVPNHAKLESADNSGMSTNLATIIDVPFSAALSGSIVAYVGFFRVPQTSTPRRYWRITLTHSNTFTSISELAFI